MASWRDEAGLSKARDPRNWKVAAGVAPEGVDEPLLSEEQGGAELQSSPDTEGAFGARTPTVMGVGRGASFGTIDELAGATEALEYANDKFNPAREKPLDDVSASDHVDEPKSFVEAYRTGRDRHRAGEKAAREQGPKEFLAGEIGGSMLVPGPKSVPGLSASAKMGRAGLTGGAQGAAYGLGTSEADLTKGEFGQAAEDTLVSGATGMGAGTILSGAGTVIGNRLKDWAGERALKAAGGIQKDLGKLSLPDQERVGEALLEEGVVRFGSGKEKILERAKKVSEAAGNEITALRQKADAAQGRVEKYILLDKIQDKINALAQSPGSAEEMAFFQSEAQKIADILPDTINVTTAGKEKAVYDSAVNFAKRNENLEPLKNKVKGEIADVFRGAENDAVAQSIPSDAAAYAAAKRRYGNMQAPKDWAEFGVSREHGNNFIPMTTFLSSGIAGGAVFANAISDGDFAKAGMALGGTAVSMLLTKIAKERGDAAAAAVAWAMATEGGQVAQKMTPVANSRILEYFNSKKDEKP